MGTEKTMGKAVIKKKISPVSIVIYIILALLVVIYIAPLLWMLNVSLKTNAEVFKSPFYSLATISLLGRRDIWERQC